MGRQQWSERGRCCSVGGWSPSHRPLIAHAGHGRLAGSARGGRLEHCYAPALASHLPTHQANHTLLLLFFRPSPHVHPVVAGCLPPSRSDNWAIWGAVAAARSRWGVAAGGACPRTPHVVASSVEHPAVIAYLTHLAEQVPLERTTYHN